VSRFDEEAKEWDKNSRRQALAEAVAKGVIEAVPAKRYDILDVGCGTGLVSYNLLPIAKRITGLDTSQKMVEEFNKKSTSPHIRAYCKPLEKCNTQCDLIVSSMTLHHIRDIERFFHIAARHMGEYLFIADLFEEDGTFHDAGNEGVWHFGFDPQKLALMARDHGFEQLVCKEIFTIQKHQDFPVFLLGLRRL